jgi:hypothetical protein
MTIPSPTPPPRHHRRDHSASCPPSVFQGPGAAPASSGSVPPARCASNSSQGLAPIRAGTVAAPLECPFFRRAFWPIPCTPRRQHTRDDAAIADETTRLPAAARRPGVGHRIGRVYSWSRSPPPPRLQQPGACSRPPPLSPRTTELPSTSPWTRSSSKASYGQNARVTCWPSTGHSLGSVRCIERTAGALGCLGASAGRQWSPCWREVPSGASAVRPACLL